MRQPARNPNEEGGRPKPIAVPSLRAHNCRLARVTARTGQPPKVASAQSLLKELSAFRRNTFENRFSRKATQLNLDLLLSRADLILLFEAALTATICNTAINGRGGCRGMIRPDREIHRIKLERMFMAARNRFCATVGYQAFSDSQKALIHSNLLAVAIADDNLAG